MNLTNKIYLKGMLGFELQNDLSPTSGEAVLSSMLVDGRCQVQSPVAFVDVAVRSFPIFFLRNLRK